MLLLSMEHPRIHYQRWRSKTLQILWAIFFTKFCKTQIWTQKTGQPNAKGRNKAPSTHSWESGNLPPKTLWWLDFRVSPCPAFHLQKEMGSMVRGLFTQNPTRKYPRKRTPKSLWYSVENLPMFPIIRPIPNYSKPLPWV